MGIRMVNAAQRLGRDTDAHVHATERAPKRRERERIQAGVARETEERARMCDRVRESEKRKAMGRREGGRERHRSITGGEREIRG